jgi:hypothetical protein
VSARIDEIAQDVHRICVYVPEFQLQFNHFLILDDEPLLFHAGLRGMFPQVREAVGRVLDPSKLRWIAFSHFESDECGALNNWLELAPSAQAACSLVGTIVGVDDYAIRPSRGLADGDVLDTGRYRFRFCATKHLCPTVGMPGFCSKRRSGPCCVRTCFTMPATGSRSPALMSSGTARPPFLSTKKDRWRITSPIRRRPRESSRSWRT